MRSQKGFSIGGALIVIVATAAVLLGSLYLTVSTFRKAGDLGAIDDLTRFRAANRGCLTTPDCPVSAPQDNDMYRFALERNGNRYDLTAVPVRTEGLWRTGNHSFYVNETGIVFRKEGGTPPRVTGANRYATDGEMVP